MSDLKQARALLEAAERDYSALRGMGDTTIFADEIFGFHTEQAGRSCSRPCLPCLARRIRPPTIWYG